MIGDDSYNYDVGSYETKRCLLDWNEVGTAFCPTAFGRRPLHGGGWFGPTRCSRKQQG